MEDALTEIFEENRNGMIHDVGLIAGAPSCILILNLLLLMFLLFLLLLRFDVAFLLIFKPNENHDRLSFLGEVRGFESPADPDIDEMIIRAANEASRWQTIVTQQSENGCKLQT